MTKKLLFTLGIAGFASAVNAQEIDYETGNYEYAQPAPELDDDVVTQTELTEDPVRSAQRVIPLRQEPRVFVSSPTVQSTIYHEDSSGMTSSDTAFVSRPSMTDSGVVDSRASVVSLFQPTDMTEPPNTATAYPFSSERIMVGRPLPAGAQIVRFDRAEWLEECRARLDTYDEGDRYNILGVSVSAGAGTASGAAVGDTIGNKSDARHDSYSQCQAYLDGYLDRAQSSAGRIPNIHDGQYMLIPVTVLVPQRAVYSDGTAVD